MPQGFLLGPLFFAWSDLVLTLVMLLLVIPLGRRYGQRLARHGFNLDTAFASGARAWVVLGGFVGLCLLMGLIYRLPHLIHPSWLGLLEPGSWLLAKAGAVLIAAMAGPLSTQQSPLKSGRQVHWAMALGVFCVLAVSGLQGWFMRPISPDLIKVRHAADGSILQSTGVTCSAAAFANALRLFGIEASEREAARILGTRDSGTSQAQLLNGARHYGLFAHYVSVRPKHVARMNRPAIVSIDLRVIMHSILVYGHDTLGNLLVIDPISGKGKLTPERYSAQLKVNEGVVLTPSPIPHIGPDSPRFLLQRVRGQLRREGLLTAAGEGYDQALTEAIKAFQRNWQIPDHGHIDAQTWLLLTGPEQGIQSKLSES